MIKRLSLILSMHVSGAFWCCPWYKTSTSPRVVSQEQHMLTTQDPANDPTPTTVELQILSPIDLSTAEFGGQVFADDQVTSLASPDAVSGWVIIQETGGFCVQGVAKVGDEWRKTNNTRSLDQAGFDRVAGEVFREQFDDAMQRITAIESTLKGHLALIRRKFESINPVSYNQQTPSTFARTDFNTSSVNPSILKVSVVRNALARLNALNEIGKLSIEAFEMLLQIYRDLGITILLNLWMNAEASLLQNAKADADMGSLLSDENASYDDILARMRARIDNAKSIMAQVDTSFSGLYLNEIRFEYGKVFADEYATGEAPRTSLDGWVIVEESDSFQILHIAKRNGQYIANPNSRPFQQEWFDIAGKKYFEQEIQMLLDTIEGKQKLVKETRLERILTAFQKINSRYGTDIPAFIPQELGEMLLSTLPKSILKVSQLRDALRKLNNLNEIEKLSIEALKICADVKIILSQRGADISHNDKSNLERARSQADLTKGTHTLSDFLNTDRDFDLTQYLIRVRGKLQSAESSLSKVSPSVHQSAEI